MYQDVVCAKSPSHDQFFVTLWTIARQAPLSMGFSRQEYWSDCRALLQGIFSTQGLNRHLSSLLHWPVDSFTTSAAWEAQQDVSS